MMIALQIQQELEISSSPCNTTYSVPNNLDYHLVYLAKDQLLRLHGHRFILSTSMLLLASLLLVGLSAYNVHRKPFTEIQDQEELKCSDYHSSPKILVLHIGRSS